ncbi:MAG: hypothetical protein ACD_3C00191G0002 [uncultured bacterium (gcode 4)]|uniref:HhH-GPD domain-containing protein n=1 Tax=uncultured bacterium (gcode 4) TaxID=1234023 RepID=K2F8W5_9BACT|nr:MAG: hypothetical protein ACD_3C00191G0002 [uncultured bacterium (gcode 4)]
MKLKTTKEAEEILLEIYALFPNMKTELNYKTQFQFLLAVIFSAQTTDKQVNVVTEKFFQIVKEPSDLSWIELEEVMKHLWSLNFYKNKSRAAKWAAEILITEFTSVIPNDLELIQMIPWVGIKTAKVVLWVLYDAPYIWVDTHVHRVCNRIWICKTISPDKTDEYLEKHISIEVKKLAHHSLVLFWRYTCTARNPKCEICKINPKCNYYQTKIQYNR